jgi:three-Cys-motif partner protein
MALEPRDPQTQVKHIILSEYLDAWAGIIVNGLSRTAKQLADQGRPFRARLLYIDGFSYKGRFAGNTGEMLRGDVADSPTWGSPVLGIQALDRAKQHARELFGFHLETAAVLVEDGADDFTDLNESLRLAGFSNRVVTDPRKVTSDDDQIAAIHGNFLQHVDTVIKLAQDRYTHTFFLLDPYGPTGIPYQAVSQIISLPRVDVMINFPYYDLHKKQGILSRADEKPADRATLANYDAMFGTHDWRARRNIAIANVLPSEVGRRVEDALTTYYRERLQSADPGLAVKYVELEFPDRERTMFYLYLTTHDPSGALNLNKILHDAKLREYQLKWHYQQSRWIQKVQKVGQQFLIPLDNEPTPASPDERIVDIPTLADDIWRTFAGQLTTLRQIYIKLANTDVFAPEIAKAMTQLKREGLAEYKDRLMDTVIRFNNVKQRGRG